jgi:hypothetical protein
LEVEMARVRVWIVHDEVGRIISIARPSKDAKVVILSGDGQSVFEADVEEDSIVELAGGSHSVDIEKKSVAANKPGGREDTPSKEGAH